MRRLQKGLCNKKICAKALGGNGNASPLNQWNITKMMHIMTDKPISAGICEHDWKKGNPAMQMPLCAATVCIHYRTTVAYSYFVFVLRSRSTPPLNIWIHPLWCRPVNICSSPRIRTQTASHTHRRQHKVEPGRKERKKEKAFEEKQPRRSQIVPM